jgi:hypothetical protein
METVNNVVSAASRAIWGDPKADGSRTDESGFEPVSGQTGNTAKGEPYDLGNSGSKLSLFTSYKTCPVLSCVTNSTRIRAVVYLKNLCEATKP